MKILSVIKRALLGAKLVFIVGLVVMIAGCATAPEINTMVDKDADFSQYKTYGFVEDLGTDKSEYSTILTKYLKTAVTSEMEAKGYQQAENPDILVNFYVSTEDKTELTKSPSTSIGIGMGRGYYNYRWGIYSVWPLYPTETNVNEYTHGTLNIDLVDADEKQLVWEGVAEGRITESFRKELQTNIRSVVHQLFEEYPFTAGSSASNTAE